MDVVESSGTSSDSDDVRQERDAKFDALDAELAEQLNDTIRHSWFHPGPQLLAHLHGRIGKAQGPQTTKV